MINNHFESFQILNYFQSASTSQKYLRQCYKSLNLEQATSLSFHNCTRFMHFIEHGISYFQQVRQSPISLQPILLFYGTIQLIKACLLTVDPYYPENTSVLAHGLSTRKRKKQSYQFLDDEVKIQRNGLFMHFSNKLFHVKQLEGEKLIMKHLLLEVPELSNAFRFLFGKNSFVLLEKTHHQSFLLSKRILNGFHMTETRFIDFFSSKIGEEMIIEQHDDHYFQLTFHGNKLEYPPLRYHFENQTLACPIEKRNSFLPELMVHYALLYNLSMIARYETEWWLELIKTNPNEDYPFITQFLSVSSHKVPIFIAHYLHPLRLENRFVF
ncbi:MAG: YaaC family protein [Bacillales bacterium]|nr:YaaC family protein [Bacillales bacterium]